ncbi:MAG: beta-ketoacyl-[acyl-carrier-protein] synthase II [Alphaproteobacteria bacterium]|nr:beta-ketoacyl-[acyl-carrier-protein] synthase II [Alphaproteobacteria bacterium]
MNRRVVVTGMGIVSPLGVGIDHVWSRLIAGESGVSAITKFETSDLAAKIAGQVPRGKGVGEFDADVHIEPKEQKKMDEFIHFAMGAADEAIAQAKLDLSTEEKRCRAGVMIGSGIGGLPEIESTVLMMNEKGPRRVSPFFIPSCLINLASGQVSIKHGLKGPNHSVVTACSTGAHAIGDAAKMIQRGDADVMVAGSAEATVCRIGIAGFAAARALSTGYNDTPTKGSRPWDEARDGFVMGEGAGILVLEEYEHAKARGATIIAEFGGYGLSGDAYHITSPADDGDGGFRSMKMALADAGLSPSDIGYINAHGTSTPKGDEIEAGAVRRLFDGVDVSMSSTKSAIGHLLGGAGSVEAIFSILAVTRGVLPPTLNLENPSESVKGMDLVPLKAKEKKVRAALSNSFGFGGTNASLVFKAIA